MKLSIATIQHVWKEKEKILEGIKNRVFTNETITAIADARMDVCNSCEHIDRDGSKCVVPGSAPCCSLCGCTLYLATASLSFECKAKKFPVILSVEDSLDISILMKTIESVERLVEDKKIDLGEAENYLQRLTSEHPIEQLRARLEVKDLMAHHYPEIS